MAAHFSKIVLLSILSISSVSHASNWIKAGENEKTTVYFDASSIRQEGKFIKIWELMDLAMPIFFDSSTPSSKYYQSAKQVRIFDCKGGRASITQYVTYSGNMGSGEITSSGRAPAPQLDDVVPDSLDDFLMKAVCSRAK